MQECSVMVRLGGSLNHTVPLPVVTPAQIQILRAIHGQDAVVDIVPGKFNKRRQEEELARLSGLYGKGSGMEGLDAKETGNIVARLFPGVSPRLPVHLKDIGLGHLITKDGAPAVSAVKAIVPGPEDDDGQDDD